jgi:hypothetical protein
LTLPHPLSLTLTLFSRREEEDEKEEEEGFLSRTVPGLYQVQSP